MGSPLNGSHEEGFEESISDSFENEVERRLFTHRDYLPTRSDLEETSPSSSFSSLPPIPESKGTTRNNSKKSVVSPRVEPQSPQRKHTKENTTSHKEEVQPFVKRKRGRKSKAELEEERRRKENIEEVNSDNGKEDRSSSPKHKKRKPRASPMKKTHKHEEEEQEEERKRLSEALPPIPIGKIATREHAKQKFEKLGHSQFLKLPSSSSPPLSHPLDW